MALGGFEQLTLNPSRADSPRFRGLSEMSQRKRRWSAMNGFSCAPCAACFTANPGSSAIIEFISLRRTGIGELKSFAKIEWLSQDAFAFSAAPGAVPRSGQSSRADDHVRVRTAFLDRIRQILGGVPRQHRVHESYIDRIVLQELQRGARGVAHLHAAVRCAQQLGEQQFSALFVVGGKRFVCWSQPSFVLPLPNA